MIPRDGRYGRGFNTPGMKLLVFLGLALIAQGGAVAVAAEEEEGAWLLAYFRQRYPGRVEIGPDGKEYQVPLEGAMEVEQLHYAISTDGRHWEPLNGNEPVWGQRLRDPFLQRQPDGTWRLMGTGRVGKRDGAGPVCLTAVSRDLVHWEDARSLPLMAGVTDDQGRPAGNIWAPEWFHDPDTGETIVLWSSSFEDTGWKKSRLWFSRTKDWKTFTPAQVLFEPPYSVIDGTLVKHEGRFYLFHKEEEFGPETGERRAIRVASAERLEGPWEIHEGPLNDGQIVPTITEGPSVMPDPLKPGWLLLYDYCMTDRFGASSSPDLLNWTIEEDVQFPPAARHGSVVKLGAEEAKALREAFPAKE